MDEPEKVIRAAYGLFNDYSIFQVIDLDRQAAVELMKELYGPLVDLGKVERYLDLLAKAKGWR